ncbi:hypothetical protein SAMN05443572_104733 [Myxococcus fulvus]|uniref:Uncharacterized protein n=1 Tax=Myxococcus fulvus TaxID=33 RepID=A0A511SZ83_MYXFU|nr:hypothetical protein [Myxococcus fulvus]GEN06633.1 hypothetical protein MFU01_16700 [Myxococcus fulvus]SEU07400.1 hypothetical protein SAMN05443572_104733 [Myxococcus fulvus]
MLSPLQPLFLLLVVEPSTCPKRLREVEAWEARTGRSLPVAVREFFTSLATIPMAPNEYPRTVWNAPEPGATIVGRVTDDEWEVSLPDLWAEYREGSLETLPPVLAAVERATSATGDALEVITPPSGLRGPLVYLQTDVMRQWRVFFELDGASDPPVHEHHRDRGWSPPRSFSSWLFAAFAGSYVHQDMVPYSFWGKNADLTRSEAACPVQPFRNGRWLRASQGPFGAEARAALEKRFSSYARAYATKATLYDFSPPEGGWIWIVADEDSSEWWIAGETNEHLAALARAARDLGQLTAPLIADTPEGAAVLELLAAATRDT